MQVIIWLLSIISASALLYGGNGGGEETISCQNGNYVEAVKLRSGHRLDGLQIKCTNQNWSAWKGGYGGGLYTWYPKASGFCGMSGRHGSRIDRLCLTSADGERLCYGGTLGGHFQDRSCSQSPFNSRARLTGFIVRSGSEIDGLTPLWNTNIDCPHYLEVRNSHWPAYFDGFYSYDRYYNGHHLYKHNIRNGCIYYDHRAWRFVGSCDTNLDGLGWWNMKLGASSHYNICPGDLGSQIGWEHNGNGPKFIYPTMQLQSHDSLPLEWGNAMGYWAYEASGSGSSGGSTRTWTTSITDTSSTSQTYSTTEQESFSHTLSHTHTIGYEVGTTSTASFDGGSTSAAQKWSTTHSLTSSTTQTTITATTNALSQTQSTSNTASQSCQSTAPAGQNWVLYAWEVYRASSVQNVGATKTTCEFQYQTGPCRFVPPNCPLGQCLDEHCIQCNPGVEPYKSLPVLQSEYPGCLDHLGIDVDGPACSLSNSDWSCCSSASPCGLHQGDCDRDEDCVGSLVCSQDTFCTNNPDCPSNGFDVCVSPNRRELSRSYHDEDDSSDEASDESSDTRFSRQNSRLLEGEKGVHSVPKDLDGPPQGALNADDIFPEEQEEDPISGCIQFDDEGHCTAGPLYKYCRWEDEQCVNKENIKDVPEGDFTYVYDFQ